MDFKWPSFTNIVRNYHMEGEFYNPLMQVSLSLFSLIHLSGAETHWRCVIDGDAGQIKMGITQIIFNDQSNVAQ